MNNHSNIERTVMRRVHTISVLRFILSGSVFAVFILILALWGIGREVWVAKILENGPIDIFGKFQYFFYAFDHTRLVVQALVLLTLASSVYLARAVARSIPFSSLVQA